MNDGQEDDFATRMESPRFWEELQETFETAIDLLHEIAEAQGVDVTVPGTEDVQNEERRLDEESRNHELVSIATEYAQEVDLWFRRAKGAIRDWGLAATQAAEEKGLTPEIEAEADDLQEAIESLADARYRISVKLIRALRCRLRGESTILSPMPGAAEKAAAEAYILIEDSISHWMRLREIIPTEEDAILHLLVNLGRLRDRMVEEFDGSFTAADPQGGESHLSASSGRT